MSRAVTSKSALIHERLGYPVIDVDGHNIEFGPLLEEYIREFAGGNGVQRYRSVDAWYLNDDETRRRLRLLKPNWGFPTKNTIDHLTAIIPALLEERLGEIGIDFTVINASPLHLGVPHMEDPDLRQPLCRALNTYQAERLQPHAARMTPAAVIPMHNPTEAIEELDYAVNVLGMKTIQMAAYVQRSMARGEQADGRRSWGMVDQVTCWDNLALDSLYDYDPVWQKCLDLHVAPAFHSGTMGLGARTSYSNSVYNHIGHFAAGCEAICKAVVLGGVARRFPSLQFAFLESGVGWAAGLYCDLIGHWKKRNRDEIQNLNPTNLDFDLARDLILQYGDAAMQSQIDRVLELQTRAEWVGDDNYPGHGDEFALAGIDSSEDIRDQFVSNFYFGCEADDPMNRVAFDAKLLPFGQRLQAVFGSDLGHWDVADMTEVLEEAYELVEREQISIDDFRCFVFTNPVKLLTTTNPAFFETTAVAQAVSSASAT